MRRPNLKMMVQQNWNRHPDPRQSGEPWECRTRSNASMCEMAAEISQLLPAMCKKATPANALNEKRFMGLTRTRSATAGEGESKLQW